ncbi:MAG: light-harvesting protein [Tabrizicola sp.]|jgi:light-harvesting protein B-800-850 alpha chain|nr:light-harvesting protein [Tabrizicola sp.]
MNNAKMWLVVKPTVGVPLFLSAVAIGSFAVHVAVLSNTSWVSDFLQGQPLGAGQATAALTTGTAPAQASYVVPSEGQSVLVILPDGRTARAVLEGTVTPAMYSGAHAGVVEQ